MLSQALIWAPYPFNVFRIFIIKVEILEEVMKCQVKTFKLLIELALEMTTPAKSYLNGFLISNMFQCHVKKVTITGSKSKMMVWPGSDRAWLTYLIERQLTIWHCKILPTWFSTLGVPQIKVRDYACLFNSLAIVIIPFLRQQFVGIQRGAETRSSRFVSSPLLTEWI